MSGIGSMGKLDKGFGEELLIELAGSAVGEDNLSWLVDDAKGIVQGEAVGPQAHGHGKPQAQAQGGADGGVGRDLVGGAAEEGAVLGLEVLFHVLLADLGQVGVGVCAEDCKHGGGWDLNLGSISLALVEGRNYGGCK